MQPTRLTAPRPAARRDLRHLVALLALIFSAITTRGQSNLGAYALTNLTIIDANHIPGLSHQTVLISNGKIVKVFADDSQALPDTVSIIHTTGRYLIPGLIDTHVHMATDPSGIDNRGNTLRVLEQMLRSGITTVRDMAGDARVLGGLARDSGPGISSARRSITPL